jgi:hypothetical protein
MPLQLWIGWINTITKQKLKIYHSISYSTNAILYNTPSYSCMYSYNPYEHIKKKTHNYKPYPQWGSLNHIRIPFLNSHSRKNPRRRQLMMGVGRRWSAGGRSGCMNHSRGMVARGGCSWRRARLDTSAARGGRHGDKDWMCVWGGWWKSFV